MSSQRHPTGTLIGSSSPVVGRSRSRSLSRRSACSAHGPEPLSKAEYSETRLRVRQGKASFPLLSNLWPPLPSSGGVANDQTTWKSADPFVVTPGAAHVTVTVAGGDASRSPSWETVTLPGAPHLVDSDGSGLPACFQGRRGQRGLRRVADRLHNRRWLSDEHVARQVMRCYPSEIELEGASPQQAA